jgi:hypothetical protein
LNTRITLSLAARITFTKEISFTAYNIQALHSTAS